MELGERHEFTNHFTITHQQSIGGSLASKQPPLELHHCPCETLSPESLSVLTIVSINPTSIWTYRSTFREDAYWRLERRPLEPQCA